MKEKSYREQIGQIDNVVHEKNPQIKANKIMQSTAEEFGLLAPHDEKAVIAIISYLIEENTISGSTYELLRSDNLMIFLIIHGGNWRSHDGQLFNYMNGAWKPMKIIEP